MIAVLLVGVQPVAAQEAADLPSLLVFNPKVTGLPEDTVDPAALAHLISALVAKDGSYQVLNQEDLVAMLHQQQQQILAGCDEVACMAELGAALGAQFQISANIGKSGDTLVVTATLIDNDNNRALGRQSVTVEAEHHVVRAVETVTLRLLGKQVELVLPPDYSPLYLTALGAGVVGLAFGAIGTGVAVQSRDQALNTADQDAFDASRGQISVWNSVAVAGWIAAGAFFTTAAVLFLIEPEDAPIEAGQLSLGLAPAAGGFMLHFGTLF